MIRNKISIVVVLFVVLLFGGCATTIKKSVELSKVDKINVEQLQALAKNLLETWPMYYGMIVGSFGNRLQDELPMRVLEAMTMLSEISKLYKNGELNDYQLGFSLGLRIQIAINVVQEAIKQFAPEIWDLLPAIF